MNPSRPNSAAAGVRRLHEALLRLGADIEVEELAAARVGASTRRAIIEFRAAHKLPGTGDLDTVTLAAIDTAAAAAEPQFQVVGIVTDAGGRRAAGLRVTAADRDLRREQPLNEAVTDERGQYRIGYSPESFSRAEKGGADLVVRVFDGERPVYQPGPGGILFNAPELAIVNITLPQRGPVPSEYERILAMVRPLLDDVPLGGLRQDAEFQDITFLAGETGLAVRPLTDFAVAQRLGQEREIPAEFTYALLAQNALLGANPRGAIGARFGIDLSSDPTLLFYDIVLLPPDTVRTAVTAAVAAAQVPATLTDRLDGILARLEAAQSEARAYVANQRPRVLMNAVSTFLDRGAVSKVADVLAQNAFGDLPTLFGELQKAAAFATPGKAEAAHTNAALADLFGYDQPILDAIRERQGLTTPEDVAKLAELDPADWRGLLGEAANDITVGGQPLRDDQISVHASKLARLLEARYPTPAFLAQLRRDGSAYGAHRDALVDLLTAEPGFDLATANIDKVLGAHPAAGGERPADLDLTVAMRAPTAAELAPAADRPGAAGRRPAQAQTLERATPKDTLKAVQRVFKIAPTYSQTTALLSAGVHSAAGIHALGKQQFVDTATATGHFTADQAHAAFHTAADIHLATGILAGQLIGGSGALRTPALGGANAAAPLISAVTKDFPNMSSLFQLGDVCECQDCRSVHGAAAYLVDVLQFLKNRLVVQAGGGAPLKQAKDVLFARRPDLGDLDLTCENTNTELPYVDLVCELLEDAVAPDAGTPYSGALTTSADPVATVSPALLTALTGAGLAFTATALVYEPDLSGARVVRDTGAVAKLVPDGADWRIHRLRQTFGDADHVMAAPQYVNAAAYTALAGSHYAFGLPFDLPFAETRGYFGQFGVDRSALMRALQSGGSPADPAIAADAIGLSDGQRTLVVTPNPAGQAAIWNTAPLPGDGIAEVDNFLNRSGLDYAGLGELLGLEWVNPGAAVFVQHEDSSCDLAKQKLANLDDATLDRMHRFLRLDNALGWSRPSLDRAIRAAKLGNGTLDDAFLVAAGQLAQLAARLGKHLDDVLDLYAPLTDARYAQVFVNASANGTVEAEFRPENVEANEAAEIAVPGSGLKLSDYVSSLALCLGARPADVSILVDTLGADAIVSFANLEAVLGTNVLAAALRLKPADLIALKVLTGLDPLAGPAAALAFADAAALLAATPITATDLRYLLRHEADDLPARELSDAAAKALLTTLQTGYQAAYTAGRPAFDPNATPDENLSGLRDVLAKVPGVGEPELGRFVAVVDGAWTDAAQTPAQFVDAVLGPLVDTTAIKAAIVPAPTEPQRTAMIQAIEDALSAYFYAAAKAALAAQAVGTAFTLSDDLVAVLLADARLHEPPAAGDRTLGDLLTDDALVDTVNVPPTPPAVTPAAFDLQYRTLRSLATIARLLAKTPIPADRLAWLLAHDDALGWLRVDGLAYQSAVTPATYASWARLRGALDLMAAYPPVVNPTDATKPWTVPGLYELILAPATTAAQVTAYLAALTGLDPAVVSALDTYFAFSTPDLSAYHDPATVHRLLDAAALLRQLGVDLPTAVGLIQPALTLVQSGALRQALKAHYSEADWWGVLRNVQDDLRTRKRDALVAYLLAANPGLRGTDDLFDYFLIDVEMSPCMPTSRIVQAHATVQLFVQRALMGLEPDGVAAVDADSGWAQWDWMANFRVWEANRKVFLYPENWILPELRDDKSELFVALENTLQQNALTDDSVTAATVTYLEQLDDIGHLEVMACHYQAPAHIMHVFARTKGGDPAVYYYRQFQQERYWTPWTRVPLDITGDHLLAFERNSRLTVVWPEFTDEADNSVQPTVPQPSSIPAGGETTDKAQHRWKIRLAVSELASAGWTPKKVSKGALYYPASGYMEDPPDADFFHFFEYGLDSAGQAVSCVAGSSFVGSFALTGCKGYPEPTQGGVGGGMLLSPRFKESKLFAERFAEDSNRVAPRDLTEFGILGTTEIFGQTPSLFEITYPMQMGLVDWLVMFVELYLTQNRSHAYLEGGEERFFQLPLGTFMPFFFGDFDRSYVLIPGFYQRRERVPDQGFSPAGIAKTYADIDQFVRDAVALLLKYLKKYLADPAHDLHAAIVAMTKDPEFARLEAEYAVYRKLRYGIRAANFYHPLTCFLRKTVNADGIPAVMRREAQLTDTGFDFVATYQPTPIVVPPFPREDLDFAADGAYSSYNWELFFHLPFEIAMRLNGDQQFQAAREWFHYIFNPVGIEPAAPAPGGPPTQRFWITKPFFQMKTSDYLQERIDDVMNAIAADPSGASISDLKFAVEQWREKPFKPHVVARSRPVAYQMAVVVNYIQNLIDWGDNLFRQFTRESVTQATQLYILADKLLGPKPLEVPPLVEPAPETYNQLEAKLDLFGNALLDLENLVPDLGLLPHGGAELPSPLTLTALYFCVPPNDVLLAKWDVVADRLLKIRSCQNIDGVEVPLPLFAPPIDPGALVRAVAAGLPISSVLAGLGAPLPAYRFQTLAKQAAELTQQVSSLGTELLSALEKRDGEAVARLRAGQEIAVLDAVRLVKQTTLAEARGAIENLKKGRQVVQERRAYYAGRDYMNAWEIAAVALNGVSLIGEAAVAVGYILSGGLKLIPNFMAGAAGFGGSPTVTATMGGQTIGNAAEMAVQVISSLNRVADKAAGMAVTQGGYQRRQDDWQFQVRLADKELAQIDVQLANAQLHVDMLTEDLAAHDKQRTNAADTAAFLHSKYTGQELYEWMSGQVSSVYFGAYQLALDTARKAERAFGHELGTDATFLRPGYWDSLHKGLMTADALLCDLKRMEAAYLDQHRREYELTKHVSLAQLDPAALLHLVQTGSCVFSIPEAMYDLDHPGQYLRRIKTVSLSIPCVAGPYTSVSAKLSLIANRYRKSTANNQGAANDTDKYAEQPGDERFAYNIGTVESIATSTGQNDAGMFELSFADERFLPFEGKGAISTWRLELPNTFRQFDYDSISDVVLQLRYTAREGGSGLRKVAEGSLRDLVQAMAVDAAQTGLTQAFNLRRTFGDQWWQLLHQHQTSLTVGSDRLPFLARGHSPAIDAVTWYARVDGNPASVQITVDGTPVTLNRDPALKLCTGSGPLPTLDTALQLAANIPGLTDLTLLVHYTLGS